MTKTARDTTFKKIPAQPLSRDLEGYFGEIFNVKGFGAVGDGSIDDTAGIQACLNAAYGPPGAPHGSSNESNHAVYFPRGIYKTSAPLTLTSVQGLRIFGDGKGVSVIRNDTVSSKVVTTNGLAFGKIENISFVLPNGGPGSMCFDWTSVTSACHNMTYQCVEFRGGEIGMMVGRDIGPNSQASEACYICCDFLDCGQWGLMMGQLNALNNVLIGGKIHGCGVNYIGLGDDSGGGIECNKGVAPIIQGVWFANNTGYDIVCSANNPVWIVGCRSTSKNFGKIGAYDTDVNSVWSCYHNGTAGGFFGAVGPANINACLTTNGLIKLTGGVPTTSKLYLRGNTYGVGQATALAPYAGAFGENI